MTGRSLLATIILIIPKLFALNVCDLVSVHDTVPPTDVYFVFDEYTSPQEHAFYRTLSAMLSSSASVTVAVIEVYGEINFVYSNQNKCGLLPLDRKRQKLGKSLRFNLQSCSQQLETLHSFTSADSFRTKHVFMRHNFMHNCSEEDFEELAERIDVPSRLHFHALSFLTPNCSEIQSWNSSGFPMTYMNVNYNCRPIEEAIHPLLTTSFEVPINGSLSESSYKESTKYPGRSAFSSARGVVKFFTLLSMILLIAVVAIILACIAIVQAIMNEDDYIYRHEADINDMNVEDLVRQYPELGVEGGIVGNGEGAGNERPLRDEGGGAADDDERPEEGVQRMGGGGADIEGQEERPQRLKFGMGVDKEWRVMDMPEGEFTDDEDSETTTACSLSEDVDRLNHTLAEIPSIVTDTETSPLLSKSNTALSCFTYPSNSNNVRRSKYQNS